MAEMLGHKTAMSGTLMVMARLISRVVDLVTMLILARLLSPTDFGLVAIAMTIIFIVEAALELPLSQALVRLRHIEESYYDTAFTLGALRGLLLCLIVCGFAVPFADFYHQPRLVALICVLSLAPAARGALNPRMAQFAKELNFKWEFLFELAGKLAAFVAGVTLALLTHSYWALAIGTVSAPVIAAVLSYCLVPFRPKLSLADWRVFGDFLGWMSVSQVVMAITWQSDQLLLGKLTRAAQLGMFTTASSIASIPMLALFGPILRPLLSAFSSLHAEPARLVTSYQSSASAVVAIGLPLMVGESLTADLIVRLMLGNKWLGAIPMLHWLTLSLVPTLFAVPLAPLVMALGRTKTLVHRNMFEMCVKLPLVIAGAVMFGFAGVIGARIISETATAGFCMVIVRRLIDVPITKQLTNCARSLAAVLVMAAAVTAFRSWHGWGDRTIDLLAELLAAVVVGAASYVSTLIALWLLAGRPFGIEHTAWSMVRRIGGRGRAMLSGAKFS